MYFDCHSHTINSDGKNTVAEMCQAAYDLGMPGITITDHCDMNFYHDRDHYNRIRKCIDEIYEQKEVYAGKMEVLCGVEMGEYLYDPENADKVLAFPGYDCILNSVVAEIYPDEEFRATQSDIGGYFDEQIDQLNNTLPPYKAIAKVIIRDTEFVKTTTKKIKRTYKK